MMEHRSTRTYDPGNPYTKTTGTMEMFCGWQKSVDHTLQSLFGRLGNFVGHHPGICIIVSVSLSLLLATGIQRLDYRNDPDYIFTPLHGPARDEQDVVKSFFPLNYSASFDPSRVYRPSRFARIIITAKDGKSLLRHKIWQEIHQVDQLVRAVRVTHDEITYSWDTLCARWDGHCFRNEVLDLGGTMEEIEDQRINMTYPIFDEVPIALIFGGLEMSNEMMMEAEQAEEEEGEEEVENGNETMTTPKMMTRIVESVEAVQLIYFLDDDSPKKNKRCEKWEKILLKTLEKRDKKWWWIKVDRFTGRTLPDQIDSSVTLMLPYGAVTGLLLFTFAFVSGFEPGDWVKSKPWLGLAGLITAHLGIMAAYGGLCYCGVPFISLCAAAPFLMLGIGMDNAFVVLSAWRQTSVYDPIPLRLSESYSEAGVSITITSLTNILCFIIGITSSFKAIQLFSIYAATTIVAIYFIHLFFFGAALALSGHHERKNRHGLWPPSVATPRSKFEDDQKLNQNDSSPWFKLFCIGGVADYEEKKIVKMADDIDLENDNDNHHDNRKKDLDPRDHPEHVVMSFFRDQWASWLLQKKVKCLIFFLYLSYILLSIWGITNIEEGMDIKRIATEDYVKDFYDMDKKYFFTFPFRVQVILKSKKTDNFIQYSDPMIQKRIENLMVDLETTEFSREGQLYNESWLRTFLEFLSKKEKNGTTNGVSVKMSEKFFLKKLQNFLKLPLYSRFAGDIKFNENKTQILASRFIIQCSNLRDWRDRRDMVKKFRDIAESAEEGSSPQLGVTVFNPEFLFLDQFFLIQSSTIQMVAVAMVVMLIVCMVLMPDPLCSIWVAGSIVSIEAGVLGFLAHWNVNLDVLSMIMLVMSCGFSVDFSAHISYAYISKSGTSEERLRSCLNSLGLPICLGSMTTILGVFVLAFAPADDFVSFFKAIFLVIVIATFHALCILPILLTFFGPADPPTSGPMEVGGNGHLPSVPQSRRQQLPQTLDIGGGCHDNFAYVDHSRL